MAKVSPLAPFTIFKPGSLGLADRNFDMGNAAPQYDEVSQNADFAPDGAIMPRAVWRNVWSQGSKPFLIGADFGSQNYMYTYDSTNIYYGPPGTRTNLTALEAVSGNLGTWTDGWWMQVTLNKKDYFFQETYKPRVIDYSGAPVLARVVAASPPQVGIVHSAFGRLWAASGKGADNRLYWSALLDGETWAGTGTGSLNMGIYMDQGEKITAISDFNRLLVVFTDKRVILLSNPFNVPVDLSGGDGTVEVMTMKETIDNTGCIGRRMWCKTGTELYFASKTGLLSLSRVVQEGGSNPLSAISTKIESIWKGGMYYAIPNASVPFSQGGFGGAALEPCMSFLPYSNTIFMSSGYNVAGAAGDYPSQDLLSSNILFHLSQVTEGLPAVTKWSYSTQGVYIIGPIREESSASIVDASATFTRTALINSVNFSYRGPAMSTRANTQDTALVVDNFEFISRTPNIYFGEQARNLTKILKRALVTLQPMVTVTDPGFTVDCVLKTYTNFRQDGYEFNFKLNSNPGITSKSTTYSIPLMGDGFSCQFELRAEIKNSVAANFRYEVLALQAKIGRLNQGI